MSGLSCRPYWREGTRGLRLRLSSADAPKPDDDCCYFVFLCSVYLFVFLNFWQGYPARLAEPPTGPRQNLGPPALNFERFRFPAPACTQKHASVLHQYALLVWLGSILSSLLSPLALACQSQKVPSSNKSVRTLYHSVHSRIPRDRRALQTGDTTSYIHTYIPTYIPASPRLHPPCPHRACSAVCMYITQPVSSARLGTLGLSIGYGPQPARVSSLDDNISSMVWSALACLSARWRDET